MSKDGLNAIVTGSASGLGAATAAILAKGGGRIAVNYSNSKKEAEETADLCRKAGAEVVVVQGDVSRDEDCKKIVAAVGGWARLDILVARAHFFPRVDITAGIGYQAFNPKYIFNPEALIAHAAGNLVAPVLNKKAIQAEYRTANAKQLEAIYNYQRVVLNAFTEVINRVSMVENATKSIEIKQQQLKALESSVATASDLFQNARAEYVEVLLAQRDLLEAKTVLIQTKRQQLSAIVNAYQALGGGVAVDASSQQPPASARPALGHLRR